MLAALGSTSCKEWKYTPRGTNRTPERGNILHVGPIGCQRVRIYTNMLAALGITSCKEWK
jgi:hypothetical protein